MTKVITFLAWDRPDYTQCLVDALSQCWGIDEYVILPRVEPGNDTVHEIVWGIDFAECRPYVNALRLGIIQNTRGALRRGFREADYVIHFEDDTIPAPDTLKFFEWAGRAYETDKTVFTVSGYNRSTPRDGWQYYMVKRRRWFHPWGWATWQDRWEEMEARWDNAGLHGGWGPNLNNQVRGERFEVFPVYARTQNIGAEHGYNVITPEWHRVHQYNAAWAGNENLPPGDFFEQQGEMWTADQMASICALIPDGIGPTELRVLFDNIHVGDTVVVYGDDRALLCAAGAGASRVILIPPHQERYVPPHDMLPPDMRNNIEVWGGDDSSAPQVDLLFVNTVDPVITQAILDEWMGRIGSNGKMATTGRLHSIDGWGIVDDVGTWLSIWKREEAGLEIASDR